MRPDELDRRAADAVEAARHSVLGVAPTPVPVGRTGDRRPARLVLAGVACLVLIVGLALLAANRGSDTTNVATQPPPGGGTPKELPAAPPVGPSQLEGGISIIATGTATTGGQWTLYLNGPAANLCLSVKVQNVEPGVCSSAGPSYQPLLFSDARAPRYVFGRMPTGVESVEVESSNGIVIGRSSVISTAVGPFYVVETAGGTPAAVRGTGGSGTPVRYELPRRTSAGRDNSAFWRFAGLIVVIVAAGSLWRRAGRARRERAGDALR